jgi:hypothetical protein
MPMIRDNTLPFEELSDVLPGQVFSHNMAFSHVVHERKRLLKVGDAAIAYLSLARCLPVSSVDLSEGVVGGVPDQLTEGNLPRTATTQVAVIFEGHDKLGSYTVATAEATIRVSPWSTTNTRIRGDTRASINLDKIVELRSEAAFVLRLLISDIRRL